MEWSRFNDQFRETEWERQQRWKATRAKRKAEGKCWQCAKLVADCTCPNVNHEAGRREMTYTQAKLIIWNPEAYDMAKVRAAVVFILGCMGARREDIDQASLLA